MNFKSNLALLISFTTLVLCIYLIYKTSTVNRVNPTTPLSNDAPDEEKATESELEIAHFMTRIQVFHNKLYFSGKNKNERLAQFYLNELEEEMGIIAGAGAFSIDPEISSNMKIYGLQQIEMMRKQIEKGFDTFDADFQSLTNSCNSCHLVTKHDYVQIKIPESPIFTNQEYGISIVPSPTK